MDGEVLMEVPQKLQMLVRLVVRGFYTTEDILIVDMLVRNFCKLDTRGDISTYKGGNVMHNCNQWL